MSGRAIEKWLALTEEQRDEAIGPLLDQAGLYFLDPPPFGDKDKGEAMMSVLDVSPRCHS